MLACGERDAVVVAPTPMHDSAVSPWFQGCLAFLDSISCHNLLLQFRSPLSVSPQSTEALTLGLLHNPYTPAPSCYPFQETCLSVRGRYGCGKDCLIFIPFRLPQISCFTLSLKCFSSDPDSCPNVGIGPLLQFPHWLRAGSVLLTFPSGSFPMSQLFPSDGQSIRASASASVLPMNIQDSFPLGSTG